MSECNIKLVTTTANSPEGFSLGEKTKLLLFDVDGTLSKSRRPVAPECLGLLRWIALKHPEIATAVVSGSDQAKILEQFAVKCKEDLYRCHDNISNPNSPLLSYCFFENGLMAYESPCPYGIDISKCVELKDARILNESSVISLLGEDTVQDLVNYILLRFSEIRLPVKRGHFVEIRTATINVSPIGRLCSIAEREEFFKYDETNGIRKTLVADLKKKFGHLNLEFAIGGQISIDIYPKGWDKSTVMGYLVKNGKIGDKFETVDFFGDRCYAGGNDFALYKHPGVRGHSVTDPCDTLCKLKSVLNDFGSVPCDDELLTF